MPAQVQIGQTLKDDEFIGMVRREVRHPTSGLQGYKGFSLCRCLTTSSARGPRRTVPR